MGLITRKFAGQVRNGAFSTAAEPLWLADTRYACPTGIMGIVGRAWLQIWLPYGHNGEHRLHIATDIPAQKGIFEQRAINNK